MAEWTIGAVVDAIAEAVPDREMTVCGARRTTFAQGAELTRRLANFLASRGLGAYRERRDLNRWECGQDVVALVMHNELYPEMVIGCLKARTVPVNVNYYYSPGEVADLLAYLKPRAVIYHRSLGAKFASVLGDGVAELLISVDDGDGAELPGSVTLEDALAQGDTDHGIAPSADDLLMVCTGGTTGRPKGVMWRQGDIYVSSMNGADHDQVSEIHDKVANAGPPWFAVSPLMHAAGMWTAFSGLLSGQTVVLHDTKPRFDPRTVLETAQREKIGLMTMVGDAYAGPIVEELGRRSYDLSSMFAIGTGGAATNPKHQRALLEHIPQITIINGFGSSETGNMGFGHTQRETPTAETFQLRAGGLVLADDYSRFLEPGDTEVGWVARNGRIPLGYFNDEAATTKTFPEVVGERVVVSGDRASLDADGTLRLLGRDSLVVNTGGEKVFVEEIEEVLRAHPHVVDALAVGRPSERWGEEVVALVSIRDTVDVPALREHCATRLARFKLPKDVLFVEEIRRLGNGKADYRWAKSLATQQAETKV
ncbi:MULTISPECIES: acyl-CoA synthetase [Mycobacterium]|uniref:Acyl-CoA synthetase n=1 Tax=Mycobacterium syngnathidarum TaxID=1908205 RepID=A0A1Q9WFK1_9MYCO|nr:MULTISPECIES: acyl-CoA synthetase [Mycobacterium]MCG7608823.1 acyl-CoA synthetase [Mycobacterium sp. CnD-18-1]OHU01482.1 acyl-CoA synthetase [Mycobacterium syngnathidarum]OLT97469.1 acyl-CoA synthetase [Mycobacterium syngnathidarum]